MLSQQMKSNNRMIEVGGVQLPTNQLIDTPSIAIAHYNFQHTSILQQQLPIKASTLPTPDGELNLNCQLLLITKPQRSQLRLGESNPF